MPLGQLSAAGRKPVLSPGDIERYHRDGFVVVPHVLSEAEVHRLRRVTDEFIENARQVTANTDIYDLEDTHSPTEPRVRRIKAPHLHHREYAALVRHQKI